ncbi:MAG TPA: sulfite exporter TauE/SafE family protein [Myxococcaceae bacterium]
MTLLEVVWVSGAALLAGALNSVAGGGSFVTVPSLIFLGVSPVVANATSTVALWPGSLASGWGYRREVLAERKSALELSLVSAVGGVAGALLLVWTPADVFLRLLPFLLLAATLLFTFGPRIREVLGARSGEETGRGTVLVLQAVIAVYGGYFGGGMGLMMLAAFALMGMTDIHRMNGLKSLMGALINGVAVVTFIVAKVVDWTIVLPMVVGAIAGGYLGATVARRLPGAYVRRFVIAVGWAMTVAFFVRG